MMAWLMNLEWDAIIQIIIIDILLGGDNAVVIALACRNLPAKSRRQGIFWGAAGAIALRVILITVAVALLDVPLLKFIGGVLLVWIGVKLLVPPQDEGGHSDIKASDKLLAAIKTIIVADFVMSLDNVIAIAGAAEQADPSQRTGLIIFGLLVSVPFIVFGSQIILKLLDRFPVIVLLGAGLLGWIAGGLIVGDVWVRPYLPDHVMVGYVGSALGALAVVVIAKVLERRRGKAKHA
jgi:YjbE family integral membrane protein